MQFQFYLWLGIGFAIPIAALLVGLNYFYQQYLDECTLLKFCNFIEAYAYTYTRQLNNLILFLYFQCFSVAQVLRARAKRTSGAIGTLSITTATRVQTKIFTANGNNVQVLLSALEHCLNNVHIYRTCISLAGVWCTLASLVVRTSVRPNFRKWWKPSN